MKKYSPLCDVAWAATKCLAGIGNPNPDDFMNSYVRVARLYARNGFRL